ncbi:unnamed protein product, partial [Allacma fusca]
MGLVRTAPFKWDSEAQSIGIELSIFRKIMWFINTSGDIFATLFVLVRTIQTSARQYESSKMAAYYTICLNFLIMSILPVALQLNSMICYEELLHFHRQAVKFITEFKENYMIPKDEKLYEDTLGLIILGFYTIFVFALFFFAAVVCVDPNIPLLFTSLF